MAPPKIQEYYSRLSITLQKGVFFSIRFAIEKLHQNNSMLGAAGYTTNRAISDLGAAEVRVRK